MGLKEQIDQELKEAIRAKDERKLSTLRLLKTAIRRAEVEKMRELSEEEILAIIADEAKKRREAIEQFSQGGREDLALQEKEELAILEAYLPKPLSREEIEEMARQAIKEVGATSPRQMGQVMKILMPRVKGRADGALVSKIVQELLAGL